MPSAWINDQFVEETGASITIRDTGLLHGAGVFTTMRSYAGKAFRLQQHLGRLRQSCEALFIPLQYRDEQLTSAVQELLWRNELQDARLRLTVTRGSAQQDPLHGLRLEPNVILTAAPLEPYPAEYYEKGLTVVLVDDQKLNPYDITAGHKTPNYLGRLTALRNANRQGAGEALWFNVHNYLQSGSITNVFIVRDGVLVTPPAPADLLDESLAATIPYPKSNVLPGITRQAVLEIARQQQLPVRIAAVTVNDLLDADEAFVTNSVMGVMPVCRIERKAIGKDKPGDLTRKLAQGYEEEIQRACA